MPPKTNCCCRQPGFLVAALFAGLLSEIRMTLGRVVTVDRQTGGQFNSAFPVASSSISSLLLRRDELNRDCRVMLWADSAGRQGPAQSHRRDRRCRGTCLT